MVLSKNCTRKGKQKKKKKKKNEQKNATTKKLFGKSQKVQTSTGQWNKKSFIIVRLLCCGFWSLWRSDRNKGTIFENEPF
jgi:hypothetical protein